MNNDEETNDEEANDEKQIKNNRESRLSPWTMDSKRSKNLQRIMGEYWWQ
jgi:hypothetical protein